MVKRSYKDVKFKVKRCSFHIYCTVCDSLVIICENTIKCANDHLNRCIVKTVKKQIVYFNPIQKNVKKEGSVSSLSSDEIEEIYLTYSVMYSKSLANYSY